MRQTRQSRAAVAQIRNRWKFAGSMLWAVHFGVPAFHRDQGARKMVPGVNAASEHRLRTIFAGLSGTPPRL
jgi:hypothetical protein